jgi:hypothetical protein
MRHWALTNAVDYSRLPAGADLDVHVGARLRVEDAHLAFRNEVPAAPPPLPGRCGSVGLCSRKPVSRLGCKVLPHTLQPEGRKGRPADTAMPHKARAGPGRAHMASGSSPLWKMKSSAL